MPYKVNIHHCCYIRFLAADVDFQSGDYHVTFQAGETTATATIKLIDDDLWEFVEDFRISFVELPEAFYVIAGPSLLVEIVDDESKCLSVRYCHLPVYLCMTLLYYKFIHKYSNPNSIKVCIHYTF